MSLKETWQPGAESRRLFQRARQWIPGGVNSPVRAFRSVGGEPFFVERAEGPYVWDADGNRYIDFVGSWGPMILGHAHPEVVQAVQAAASRGTSFGAPHAGEVELAEIVGGMMPAVEKMRLVNSGTEATMSAVRLARAHTKRSKVVKFVGCYHGHADSFLIQAGSGAATFGQPDSPGVTPGTAADTLAVNYNDLKAVEALFAGNLDEIAAVIVEPVAGNMGCVPPVDGFLEGLREICDRRGSLLIFDEVITGFRLGPGGAQERFGVRPDLTTLGKILGGGLPVGAYGGRRDLMDEISPDGPVYQAGTLSGNPLAVAAGLGALRHVQGRPGLYDELEQKGAYLEQELRRGAEAAGIPLTVHRLGSMLGLFFHPGPVRTWDEVSASDRGAFTAYFAGLLKRGVWIAPSPFEAMFVSAAHGDEDLQVAAAAMQAALREAAA
ncbi:MAG: glutamate-1-semialdehyde 2,1-aminomutase [Candidatus Eisenbacteria bacterium]|nr:glutamate-1-semialdehyde 2,1-aminomutase [Candidatus Eisenbacteria bacterium]